MALSDAVLIAIPPPMTSLAPEAFVILTLGGLLAAESRGSQSGRILFKILASAGFLVIALRTGAADWPRAIIRVGLVFGFLGDLLLLASAKRWFLLGLGSFLVNHVAYAAAMLVLGVDPLVVGLAALPLGVIGVAVHRWLIPRTGSLKVPVQAYILVILTMAALAAGTGIPVLAVAATCFFVSDLAVARQRFDVATPWNKAWGLPLYYVAQVLFARW